MKKLDFTKTTSASTLTKIQGEYFSGATSSPDPPTQTGATGTLVKFSNNANAVYE